MGFRSQTIDQQDEANILLLCLSAAARGRGRCFVQKSSNNNQLVSRLAGADSEARARNAILRRQRAGKAERASHVGDIVLIAGSDRSVGRSVSQSWASWLPNQRRVISSDDWLLAWCGRPRLRT